MTVPELQSAARPDAEALGPCDAPQAPDLSAPSAMERAYVEHALLLRRIAVRKFGVPEEEAECLVHDIFIACLVRPPGVRSNLRSYLIAAICNASRNYWRSKRVREGSNDSGGVSEAPVVLEDGFVEGLSLRMMIGATLARLGSRCREVLRRYYLEEEETHSIAAAIDTTAANVNYLMHVCRKKARRIYEEISGAP